MSDQEKFEALKKTAIEENEKVYGNEIRRKYGEEAVDASYGKIRGMSQQEWEDFRQMEQEILVRLQTAVQQGLNPEGKRAGRLRSFISNGSAEPGNSIPRRHIWGWRKCILLMNVLKGIMIRT